MAAAGTLLADLEPNGGDGDLVQKILSDMNIPTASARPAPPPLPAQTPVYQQQMASSTSQIAMDSRIPTSHVIGNEHPTPAEFASAMGPMSQGQGQMGGQMQMQGMQTPMTHMGGMQGHMGHMGQMGGMQMQQMQNPVYEAPSKNIYSRILDEAKVPLVVAIIFFVFSLPPIRVLLAHYVPTLIKQTGEFQVTGLLTVSLMAGATFWMLQRVIAPLLSL
jgi:hypothetical protein